MYNREILTYNIDKRPNLGLAIHALTRALPLIAKGKYRTTIHTDQGWHYQHKLWSHTLKKHSIFQSMSRKGNCLDNSVMENFFGLLKQEMYYGRVYDSYDELKKCIEAYIYYYNTVRIKEKLAGLSPVQYRIQSNQFCQ